MNCFPCLLLLPVLVVACSTTPTPKNPDPQGLTPIALSDSAGPPPDSTGPTGPSSTTVDSPANPATLRISPEILRACGITEPQAFFSFDSALLRRQDTDPLDKVATCFVTGPLKGRTLRLVGHADPRGQQEYNMHLGQKRADAVGSYLAKSMPKGQIETTTRGAMDATGTDEAGYGRDRRVDILLGQK